MKGEAENRLLDQLLGHFKEKGWLTGGGKQRTDSTHVLSAIRERNRIECPDPRADVESSRVALRRRSDGDVREERM